MLAYAYGGSWWVHTDAVIHVIPDININFITTLRTLKGDVLINMSTSINVSAHLVSMNEHVVLMRSTYQNHIRPYSYINYIV